MDTTTATVTYATSREVLERFLAGYGTPRTRDNERVHPDPVARLVPRTPTRAGRRCGRRGARDLHRRAQDHRVRPDTIVGRVSAISAFYRWCVRERLADRNPVELIRRPARPAESATASLTRHRLTDWLAAAEHRGGAWSAAAMLLGLNACGAES